MACPELVDRFKRHKTGTAKIVNYIATAARRCREVTDILPSLAAAKKAAKQAKKQPGKASDASTQVNITTAQLISLAEIVANSSTAVPKRMFSLLDNVIAGREDCAAWYASIESPEMGTNDPQNKGHQYFIDVLKQVRKLLVEARGVGNEANSNGHRDRYQANTNAISLENSFAGLEVEEPSATPLGGEPMNNRTSYVEVSFKLQDSEGEKTFALWCFLRDMYDLRRSLKALWDDYDAGLTSFMAASLATETGFSIMRYADEEFVEAYPEFKSFSDRVKWMHMAVCMMNQTCFVYPEWPDGVPRLLGPPSRKGGDVIAELFCPPALSMLMAFQNIMSPNGEHESAFTSFCTNTEYQIFDLHPFSEVLMQIVPNIQIACSGYADEMHWDTFVLGLTMLRTQPNTIPSWLVSACQNYIDIWDVIGRDSTLGQRELNKRVTRGLRDGQAFKTMPGMDGFEKYCISVPLCFAACQNIWTFCMEDPIMKAFEKMRTEGVVVGNGITLERQKLLKALPIYAGSLAWIASDLTYRTGILLCNNGFVVIAAAYLYKTCRRAGLLDSSWTDMDFVIATHSQDKPLILESPDGVKGMAKNFAIALGVSPIIFSGSKRPVLPNRGRARKKLEVTFPLIRVTGKETRRKAAYMENVTAALRCVALVEEEALCEHRDNVLDIPGTGSKAATSRFTPTQLLLAFKDVFVAFETDLNFNYTGLYMLCLDLLRKVLFAVENYFRRHCPKVAPDWNRYFVELVYAILWDAEDSGNDELNRNRSPALSSASEILAQFIEQHGEELHNTATESKGRNQAPRCKDERLHSEDEYSENFLKLLEWFDCPLPGQSGKSVFCSSSAEVAARAKTSGALLALAKKYQTGPDRGSIPITETSNILNLVESTAAASIKRMNEEEIECLALFANLYLTQTDQELEDQATELCGFVARNYSASARQYLKGRFKDMPPKIKKEVLMRRLLE